MGQTEQPRWSRRARELPAPAGDRVVLAAVGEAVLASTFYYRAPVPTRTLFGLLRDTDFAVATLATTLTDVGAPEPKDAFLGPAILSDDLSAAGVRAVSLATNHFFDGAAPGVAQTLGALRRVGIEPIGAGDTLEAARRVSQRTIKGVRVATLAVHTAVDWDRPRGSLAAGTASPGVAPLRARRVRGGFSPDSAAILPLDPDLREIEGAVRQARRNADVVMVLLNIHWPDGSVQLSSIAPGLRLAARAIAEAGADLIVGSGGMRLGPIERIRNTWVFYGVGNFVLQLFGPDGPAGRFELFPETEAKIRRWQNDPASFASVMVRPVVSKGKIARIDVVPFALETDGLPRVATDVEAATILGDLKTSSQPFGAALAIEGWRGVLGQEAQS